MEQSWKKKTVIFILSQTVSLLGSSLVQYAILWHITLSTQSGLMMTLSIICGFLPSFFLSPFAGVFADRYNRKTLIILADAGIAAVTLLLAVVFMAGYDAIWLLFVISAIRSLGTGIQIPAEGAILPQFVPEGNLTRVNAVNTTIQSVISLISPMLSGALMAFAKLEVIFFIDVVTAAIAIFILITMLHVPPHKKAMEAHTTGYLSDFISGLKYLKTHGFIIRFLSFSAVFFFLAAPAAFLTPLQVARSFNGGVWELSAIEIAFSLGMVLGGLLMTAWGGFKNRIHTMFFAGILLGIFTFSMGVIPVFWLYLIVMGLTGLAIPFYNTPATVMLQEKVEESYLGRVFGLFGMIASAVMPIGMLVFGPLSDKIDIEWLLIGTGVLMTAASAALIGSKALVKEGLPVKKASE